MDKLTIPQALEQGYTHYTVDQEEEVGKLEHLLENGVEEYNRAKKVVLMSKTTMTFSISADTIQQLLTDHIAVKKISQWKTILFMMSLMWLTLIR